MSRTYVTEELIDKFVELYHQGYKIVEIANEFDADPNTVSRYLRQRGEKIGQTNVYKAAQACQLYLSGLSEESVGNKLGLCRITVRRILKRNDIPIRSLSECHTKYPVIEDYFDVIDTPNKAYILGFFYADGNVNDKNMLQIALQSTDLHILESMKKEFGCIERPIVFDMRSQRDPNHQDAVLLTIKNQRLHDGLVKHGVVPRKTHILTYPTFLTDNLQRHFLRGLMDGDGCIHKSEFDHCFTAAVDVVCGTYDICQGVNDVLEKHLNICGSIVGNNKKSGNYKVCLSGRNKCLKYLDWIYEDAEMYLFRKYEIYLARYKNTDLN